MHKHHHHKKHSKKLFAFLIVAAIAIIAFFSCVKEKPVAHQIQDAPLVLTTIESQTNYVNKTNFVEVISTNVVDVTNVEKKTVTTFFTKTNWVTMTNFCSVCCCDTNHWYDFLRYTPLPVKHPAPKATNALWIK